MSHKYLTQEEVDALPEGTVVMINWAGTNGTHKYIVGNKDGHAYTTAVDADGNRYLTGPIENVGPAKPRVLVYVYEE